MLGSRSGICVSIPRRRGYHDWDLHTGATRTRQSFLHCLSGIEPVPNLVPPGSRFHGELA